MGRRSSETTAGQHQSARDTELCGVLHQMRRGRPSGRTTVKVFGISAVRDEADIIRVNVLHHLSLGIDRLLIIDNGSSDGTARELERLGRDARVQWTVNTSPYREAELITGLA